MIILGIYDDHNASAAIYKDGCIVFAAQEERFTREKNHAGFPRHAISCGLKSLGLTVKDLDYVVFASTNNDPFWSGAFSHRFSVRDYIEEQNEYWHPVFYKNKKSDYFVRRTEINTHDRILRKHLKDYRKFSYGRDHARKTKEAIIFYQTMRKKLFYEYFDYHDKVLFYDHHVSHAAYAYWAAPYSVRRNAGSLILTLDAFGDSNNCLLSVINGNKGIQDLLSYSRLNIARFYKYCTLLLGMKPLEHEYKVMGLAPYCKNEKAKREIFSVYKKALWLTDDLKLTSAVPVKDSYFHFKKLFESYRFDEIAAGIQYYFESFVTRLADLCLKKYKKNTLFFNGGAAMNVKANYKVSELKRVKDLYISPSPADDSTSIGACLYAASQYDKDFDRKRHPFPSIYLGYEITDQECNKVINKYFYNTKQFKTYRDVSARAVAGYLSRNLIIARAAYKMEFGARALGNRSIIANPLSFDNVRKMNEKIKLRDFWMPFAPVILKEWERVYIHNPKKLTSPYMMLSFPTTKIGKEKLAAAKHPYDDTVRPQILSREDNFSYYDLIREFGKLTGVNALVNTSFNLHGFPIVCTATDAAKVFLETDLDGLLLNRHLILKRKNQTRQCSKKEIV